MESVLKILCLCFYFKPDLSAGSFKNSALVHELSAQVPEGSEVTVIATLPNRYASFDVSAPAYEQHGNVHIHRLQLPGHQSGMLDQSRAFLSYARGVMRLANRQHFDLVYASSSRLMMSVLGAWVSKRQNIPLYLDIRDLFLDTIKEVLPGKLTLLAMPVFAVLEKWAIRRASHVNVVSGGFVPYFTRNYPEVQLSQFTNGIDQEFLDAAPAESRTIDKTISEVLYAGNMGEGQGLHHIISGLAKQFEGRLNFRLVGAGGRQAQLQQALQAAGVTNVTVQPPVSREVLVGLYDQADILFLHLNDFDAFKKVLPSKIFEYGALGKPVWAGVGGYAAEFIQENLDNSAVFSPCDIAAATKAFETLEMKVAPRKEFVAKFSRHAIINRMAKEIISFAAPAQVGSDNKLKSGVE